MGWRLASVLVAGLLAACNPHGLTPVDDTGEDDTGGDTGVAGLIGILVTPDRAAVPLGGELQLVATGLRDDRTSVEDIAVPHLRRGLAPAGDVRPRPQQGESRS